MLDKGIREGRSRENERRRRKYEDYITDKAYKAMMAAAIGRRLPYHLTYARMAGAGIVQGQRKPVKKTRGGHHEQKRGQ